jgi:predicted transcriptional regulator of viral defense system
MSPEQSGTGRELLSLQHGVISRVQALELGLGPRTVSSRLRSGRWQQLYRGVYATYTGEPGREAWLWAAVLRVGPDAALSYQTAAELDRLTPRPSPLIHLTVPREQHVRAIPGLVIHRSSRIRTARHPALTPPRTRIEETTLDLAQAAPDLDDAFAWLARACAGRLTTPARLGAALDQREKMRWRNDLAAALGDVSAGAHSALERRYVRDVERSHGLPSARRQVRTTRATHTEYKDVLYEEFGVGVELDGDLAHPPDAHWRDRHRDNAAAAHGITTLRYSWPDVVRRPCHVAAEVATVLRLRGWRGTLRPCGPACRAGD